MAFRKTRSNISAAVAMTTEPIMANAQNFIVRRAFTVAFENAIFSLMYLNTLNA